MIRIWTTSDIKPIYWSCLILSKLKLIHTTNLHILQFLVVNLTLFHMANSLV